MASQLVSGLTATSLAAPAIVLRSRITLRPLVSVPPIDGNLASSRVVSPTCTTRSDNLGGVGGQGRVAGPAAAISSVMVLVLGIEFVGETRQFGQCRRDLAGPGVQRADQLVGLADQLPNACPWSPVALPKPLMMLVKLRTAPPFTRTAAELSTDSTVAAAAVGLQTDGVAALQHWRVRWINGAGGLSDTNTSPSGVAVRNSAVLPRGNWTPSRMRSVVTAV